MPNKTGEKRDFQCKDAFDPYRVTQWQLNSLLCWRKKYSFPVCRVLGKSLFTGVV